MGKHADPLIERVRLLLEGMYSDYLSGDSDSIDARLTEDVTIFDSSAPELVVGLEGLAALRLRRTEARTAALGEPARPEASAVIETVLTVTALDVREVRGAVVASWWLRVNGEDASGAPVPPELSRNSAVLRDDGGRLRIVHLHEDVRQPLGEIVRGASDAPH